jgi:hypothetical protein
VVVTKNLRKNKGAATEIGARVMDQRIYDFRGFIFGTFDILQYTQKQITAGQRRVILIARGSETGHSDRIFAWRVTGRGSNVGKDRDPGPGPGRDLLSRSRVPVFFFAGTPGRN